MSAEERQIPNFAEMNEADVRAEVIDPLLQRLGYSSGTENNILRERHIELRYPHIFLGRKKPEKDPVLRGIPDYICEVREYGRWVIEAKPPSQDIGVDDVEQAHSYSVHPEIQARLFVLCNGRSLLAFESIRGPGANPILELSYEEISTQHYVLTNLLGPSAFRSRYPVTEVDFGQPLADGLGSRATIVGGFSRYDEIEAIGDRLPQGMPPLDFSGMQNLCGVVHSIVGDDCFRDGTDGIVANVRVPSFHEMLRNFAKSINLEVTRYVCRDQFISKDPNCPSIFEATIQYVIPQGTQLLNLGDWTKSQAPLPIPVTSYSEAVGHLDQNCFKGSYSNRTVLLFDAGDIDFDIWLFMQGVFEVQFD